MMAKVQSKGTHTHTTVYIEVVLAQTYEKLYFPSGKVKNKINQTLPPTENKKKPKT